MEGVQRGVLLLAVLAAGCSPAGDAGKPDMSPHETPKVVEIATFAAGCFWCVEAVFERIEGVRSVESGYTGGDVKNPTYPQVCAGTTGHAEACRITFDPEKVSYTELLEIFFKSHDPTTLNRQGNDVGTQYRSAIFTHSVRQRELAETARRELDAAEIFDGEIVTEIAPEGAWYPAEDCHQEYYENNPNQGYCRFVIRPKVEKVEKLFKGKLKR